MQDTLVIVFNLMEIVCQSHQAHVMFRMSVEPVKMLSFGLVVVFYSFASPWFLFLRSMRTKATLFNFADTIVSFILSTGHPLASLVFTLLRYVVVDQTLGQDNLWATQSILLTRLLVPSSAFDLMCKIGMHLGTFIALRRSRSTVELLKKSRTSPLTRLSLRRTRFHWVVRLNVVISVGWSLALLGAMIVALNYRAQCPPYCLAISSPLWSLTCECAYANLNCVKLGIDDPIPLLSPQAIGTSLFYLQISRCAIPNGLPPDAIAPFSRLCKVLVLFSNLSTWEGPLPPSVAFVSIRFSTALRVIPNALQQAPLSPHLVVIVIEGCPLESVPAAVVQAWSHLICLSLINVNLSVLPDGIGTLPHLELLNLKLNRITTVPDMFGSPRDLPNIKMVRLNWNRLTQVPPAIAQRSNVVLELSGNPIETAGKTTPTALQKRTVVLDNSPFCENATTRPISGSCRPVCGYGCEANWIHDHLCDWACFTQACSYDGGDCDEFGFDLPS
ncbi:hypothetical protein DYB32_009921 [Aphanomyces invadans]|uniref:LNR domain-containing protein n=1 Tax=Aphanomyces invadans TaxID=157072 RepID=A0A3R6VEL1_9STRA|nr:hypothetical protein DYB32_009921 [Aphanomyces invadans]